MLTLADEHRILGSRWILQVEAGGLNTDSPEAKGLDRGVTSKSAMRLSRELEPTLPFTGRGLSTGADRTE